MLAHMRAYIRANMPQIHRLITYHDAARHTGAIYRADNWQLVPLPPKVHTWTNRAGRTARPAQVLVKWERTP
jgi:hypothetical protein